MPLMSKPLDVYQTEIRGLVRIEIIKLSFRRQNGPKISLPQLHPKKKKEIEDKYWQHILTSLRMPADRED